MHASDAWAATTHPTRHQPGSQQMRMGLPMTRLPACSSAYDLDRSMDGNLYANTLASSLTEAADIALVDYVWAQFTLDRV